LQENHRQNRKYLAFAAKADSGGIFAGGKIVSRGGGSGTVSRPRPLAGIKGIRSTKENLQEAIAGETHEFKSMYPGMIQTAKAEGNKEAERSFNYANESGENSCRSLSANA